jgi:hypothetical protein
VVSDQLSVANCQVAGDAGGVNGRAVVGAVVGAVGFALYVVLVVILADLVVPLHWAIVLLFFLAAGTLWAWPALRLLRWALAAPEPHS